MEVNIERGLMSKSSNILLLNGWLTRSENMNMTSHTLVPPELYTPLPKYSFSICQNYFFH